MFSKFKLSLKIQIAFLFIALIPFLGISFLTFSHVKKNTEMMVEEYLSQLTFETNIQIERTIFSAYTNIQTLAKNPVIQSEFSTIQQKKEEMIKIESFYKVFDDISLLNLDGSVLASTKYNYRGAWKYKDWFKQAKAGKVAASPPHIVLSPHRTVMVLTFPVLDQDGNVIAVLGGQIKMENVWDVAGRLKIGETGFIFILDQFGNFIAHPQREMIFEKIIPEEARLNILSSDRGTIEYDENEVEKICHFQLSRGYDRYVGQQWRMGIIQEKQEAYAILDDIKRQIILVAAIGVILILLLASIVSHWLTQPIKELSLATEKIASGDLVSSVRIRRNDELGDLGKSFNKMAGDLQKTTVSRDYVNNIIKSMSDILIVFNTDFKIITVNSAICNLLSYTEDELLGKNVALVSPDDKIFSEDAIELLKDTTIDNHETNFVTKDRKIIPVLFSVSLMKDRKDNVIGVLGMAKDITDRKKIEAQLVQANKDLAQNEKMLRKMLAESKKVHGKLKNTQNKLIQSEKLAAIGQLSAGIAHEINNPVGFISSNMEILAQYIDAFITVYEYARKISQSVSSDNYEVVKEISAQLTAYEEDKNISFIISDIPALVNESNSGLKRIKKIVLDLRNFTRADQDMMGWNSIEQVMEDAINIVYHEIKYKADIVKEYSNLPKIICNPLRLGQVFINLLTNAAQSIPEKGVITIKTYQEDQKICIAIQDTGDGIPAESISLIFEPFYTTKSIGKGTGLGLSIVFDIVHQHGGDINVVSKLGEGATFIISFPVEQDLNKLERS